MPYYSLFFPYFLYLIIPTLSLLFLHGMNHRHCLLAWSMLPWFMLPWSMLPWSTILIEYFCIICLIYNELSRLRTCVIYINALPHEIYLVKRCYNVAATSTLQHSLNLPELDIWYYSFTILNKTHLWIFYIFFCIICLIDNEVVVKHSITSKSNLMDNDELVSSTLPHEIYFAQTLLQSCCNVCPKQA